MRRSRKDQDSGPKYYLNHRAFENAKWVLKDKKTGKIIECDYRKMSDMVQNGYVSYHNRRFANDIYKSERIKIENIRTRELDIAGGSVAEINKSIVVGIGYEEVLPNYTVIDCYDYKYQCPVCAVPTDEIRGQGEEKEKELFCMKCFRLVKCR